MRLDRLQLTAFGKFADRELEFAPGLNLIYGANEAGKSTLQNFIRGMLFGFKRQGTRRTYDELLERYRPWVGGNYSGIMEYTLEGRPYRIERCFEPEEEKVKVLDGSTWEDLTTNFSMDKRKEVLFAQEHLGISQVIFDNTVCVRQLQNKSAQELVSEIQSKLVNLASAGEEDVSIQQALQVLDQQLKELGITERSGKTSLGKITALVEKLEQERLQTLQGYEEIRGAEANRQAQVEELSVLNRALLELTRDIKAAQLAEVREKIEKVAGYEYRIDEFKAKLQGLERYIHFPLGEKDNLLIAEERTTQAERTGVTFGARLEQLAAQRRVKLHTLERLQSFANFTHEDITALQNGFTRLEESAGQAQELEHKRQELVARRQVVEEKYNELAGCAELGPEGEAEINQLEEELSDLKLNSRSLELERLELSEGNLARRIKGRHTLGLGSVFLGLIAGAGLGWLVFWAYGLLVFLGLGLGLWLHFGSANDKKKLVEIKRRIKEARVHVTSMAGGIQEKTVRLNQLLSKAGVSDSRELNEKMRQLLLIQHSRQSMYLELVNLEDNLAKLRQRLRDDAKQIELNYLAPAGILEPGQNISREHIQEFCSGVSSYLSLKAEEHSLAQQEQELLVQQEAILSGAKTALEQKQQILSKAGVKTVEEFLSGCEAALQLQELQGSLEALKVARSEVLGQFTIEELRITLEKLNSELGSTHLNARLSPEEIREEIEKLNTQILETKELIANLQGIIETRLKGSRNLADIEEELHQAWQEKERILRQRKAVEIARQAVLEVSQSVQREFSPVLNEHLGKTVNSLTAGRYLATKIDHDLNVKVVVPETGEVKDISNLSLGTVDQFYFGLRLALADLIGVKFPLVLDDAFVQYDDRRLREALGLLCRLAEQRQIILFSCHQREKAILDSLAPENYHLITL